MSVYKLENLIRARFPMIYITTFEEDRVTKYIKSVVSDETQVKYPREVFTWTQSNGLKTDERIIPNTTSPARLIEYITKYENNGVKHIVTHWPILNTKKGATAFPICA